MSDCRSLPRNNPLRDRAELCDALRVLLAPLDEHYIDDGGGFHLGASGARFSPRIALLEGFSRSLWGIAPFLAGGGSCPVAEAAPERLRRGVDPNDPAYWGAPGGSDQRLVEMAAIALCLLIAPDRFWEPLAPIDRQNLYAWLASVERVRLPENNWQFFRLLVGAAFRSLGLPVDEAAEKHSSDLIESMYCGDGWYRDGIDENFDNYNAFGFHFYGLLLARIAETEKRDGGYAPAVEERRRIAARYRERARLFARQFLPWIHSDGSIVPYGRSLTYRFGVIAFFGACAFAGEEVLPWPVIKGIVLRQFRWWFGRPILDGEGLLTVGYTYPNLIMAEQYNSPGSPYWSLKAFLPLALRDDHPFWRADEAPLPESPSVSHSAVPHYLFSRSAEDTVLLNPGRYPGKEMVQAAAKFSKFAYSARFGFCVSHGAYGLEKTGCDSMLVLSEGDGYWRERRQTEGQKSGAVWTYGLWHPWPKVAIRTLLIAAGAWHLRFHLIRSDRILQSAEGGFAVPCFFNLEPAIEPELAGSGDGDLAIVFPWAATRIIDLKIEYAGAQSVGRAAESLTPEPNLNIVNPSVVMPILRGVISIGESFMGCAVRAGDGESCRTAVPPSIRIEKTALTIETDSGSLALPIAAIFT